MYTLVTPDIVISYARITITPRLYYTDHCYFMHLYHHYKDTIISCSYITIIWINMYTWFNCLCLYVAWNTVHVTWSTIVKYFYIKYMTVFCDPDIDMIFLLLDMLAIDMRCVKLSATSHACVVGGHLLNPIPPVSCFSLSFLMISIKLMSSYRVTCTMHCCCSWHAV